MCAVFFGGCATGSCASDRANCYLTITQAHQNFRACANHLKAAKVEKEQKWRRVGATQAAIKGKGGQRKILGPTLGGDHLKDVTGPDIIFGTFHGGLIGVFGEIRYRLGDWGGIAQITGPAWHLTIQIAQCIHHPFGCLCIGRPRRQARTGPCGRYQRHLALNTIKHRHHRGAQHDRIGQAQRIRVDVGQMFHQPDHIIAQIAKKPGCNRRQIIGQINPAFGQ